MGDEDADRKEAALRRLPEAYSLALRLTEAGVAEPVLCEYLRIDPEGLETLVDLGRRKLASELQKPQ